MGTTASFMFVYEWSELSSLEFKITLFCLKHFGHNNYFQKRAITRAFIYCYFESSVVRRIRLLAEEVILLFIILS